ncbi:MAG TPA: 16S rRNA (cytidine(1402)-2'-O)-methyltransferase, partial [Candidatus Angelobacter sp.]|nr:16S rRNA (cytidine(1402)-2'-O)-methyltransferase [Candidatus Angelobacter sp.]
AARASAILTAGIERKMAERNKPGTLFVVATPIGNLEDITYRAVRVLKEADLIACEDTRHTAKLLQHYAIDKPTISYHEHNEAARAEELVARLERGENIAQVSDAGMPGISDPGYRVIKLAIERSVPVIPIPGASALVAALAASGLPTDSFQFLGFLPAKSGQRRTLLESLREAQCTVVVYEAPHRIVETMQDVVESLGAERPIVLARELTKVHEEFVRGTAGEVLRHARERELKGEITLLIGRHEKEVAASPRQNILERVEEIMKEQQVDENSALKIIARERGVSKSEAYRELQRLQARKHS